jgi:hypothetical protein
MSLVPLSRPVLGRGWSPACVLPASNGHRHPYRRRRLIRIRRIDRHDMVLGRERHGPGYAQLAWSDVSAIGVRAE